MKFGMLLYTAHSRFEVNLVEARLERPGSLQMPERA
jgi:hypothetical protein